MLTNKFNKGDRVLYDGEVYKVTDVKFFGCGINTYGYLLISEKDGRETGCHIFESHLTCVEEYPTEKEFTKADLKPTDIVKYKSGEIGIILANSLSKDGLGVFPILGDSCIGYLSDFNDDLTYSSENMRYRDIVAVYSKDKSTSNLTLTKFFRENRFDSEWTWERKEEPKVKEITASEAAKLLKEKFPDYEGVKIIV